MARPPRQHDPKTRRHSRAYPSHDVFVAARKKDLDARDFCANARKTRFTLLRGHDEFR
jgi:hypothetical protein